jgi:hypothetical protein
VRRRRRRMSRTIDLLRLAFVPRWSIVPMLRPQSVAEHSFNVAVIGADLAQAWAPDRPLMTNYVMVMGLLHDAEEAVTGDIPGNFKHDVPVLRILLENYSDRAMPWIKGTSFIGDILPNDDVLANAQICLDIADTMEAITYLRRWGSWNTRVDKIIRKLSTLLAERVAMAPDLVQARSNQLYTDIMEEDDGKDSKDDPCRNQGGSGDGEVPDFEGASGCKLRLLDRPNPDPVHPGPAGGGEGEGT